MKLSVIVPTLNEERSLPRALASIPRGAEVIVADGRSVDRTREVAGQFHARVVVGEPGRGAQSNRGAEHASGEVLLFLHADCVLDRGADEAIADALSDPRVVGGSFRLRIRPTTIGLTLVAFGSNLRARFLKLPYGDQALFVRRKVFEELGGYREIPIMEDVDLVRRLKKRGRLRHLDAAVTTTPRHWESLGPLCTTLLNWMAMVGFTLGAPPYQLASVYHRLRRRPRATTNQDSIVASHD
jgi:rSAM/selenodomain-associated transferase 2